jgi:hypothetical protein
MSRLSCRLSWTHGKRLVLLIPHPLRNFLELLHPECGLVDALEKEVHLRNRTCPQAIGEPRFELLVLAVACQAVEAVDRTLEDAVDHLLAFAWLHAPDSVPAVFPHGSDFLDHEVLKPHPVSLGDGQAAEENGALLLFRRSPQRDSYSKGEGIVAFGVDPLHEFDVQVDECGVILHPRQALAEHLGEVHLDHAHRGGGLLLLPLVRVFPEEHHDFSVGVSGAVNVLGGLVDLAVDVFFAGVLFLEDEGFDGKELEPLVGGPAPFAVFDVVVLDAVLDVGLVDRYGLMETRSLDGGHELQHFVLVELRPGLVRVGDDVGHGNFHDLPHHGRLEVGRFCRSLVSLLSLHVGPLYGVSMIRNNLSMQMHELLQCYSFTSFVYILSLIEKYGRIVAI